MSKKLIVMIFLVFSAAYSSDCTDYKPISELFLRTGDSYHYITLEGVGIINNEITKNCRSNERLAKFAFLVSDPKANQFLATALTAASSGVVMRVCFDQPNTTLDENCRIVSVALQPDP